MAQGRHPPLVPAQGRLWAGARASVIPAHVRLGGRWRKGVTPLGSGARASGGSLAQGRHPPLVPAQGRLGGRWRKGVTPPWFRRKGVCGPGVCRRRSPGRKSASPPGRKSASPPKAHVGVAPGRLSARGRGGDRSKCIAHQQRSAGGAFVHLVVGVERRQLQRLRKMCLTAQGC